MVTDIRQWIYAAWGFFFFGWMLWGLTSKQTKRQQPPSSRLAQAAVFGVAFWMLSSANSSTGPLGWRILPHSATTEFAAVALTLIGFGIAIWARLHLGGNWSATVTVKHGHQLVQSGPYAFVR